MICPRCSSENADTAKFCSQCGSPLASPAREQRKTVTVLFCDVSGSTALGERVDPEALRAIMARYFDVARAAIERHGGTVEKFIGDAVMAVFGIPVVHEDDALRAVRAAVELRDAVTVDVRIGVNTGGVVTGGDDKLATGDAVNVAARLEQAAGTGEILVGESTYALVRDAVDADLLPPVQAKGKSEPLTVYRVDAVRAGLRRRDAAPMVGRGRELELLAQAYDRAVHEQACLLFTILGTAGIGKSRLVSEFLAGLGGARVVGGRCLSYGEGITYWPVVEVLKQLDVAADAVIGDGTTPGEIAWSVRKTLEAAALERPLVVVFDDIQWGEPTFLDLVEHVADLSRDAPILLLCMARPELLDVRPGWGGGKLNATSVLLERLGSADTDALVHELFEDADAGFVERIRAAADGNPLFVEEMVELARVSGGDVAVPPTIQALLTARLDSLPDEERAVLERGAVEGQVFHRSAVAALAPEEAQVDTRLVSLVRKELVRPDRAALAADDAYRFRHLLIRDAAYEALPKSTRIELHERFATWLEEYGADLVELDEIVGYHLEQAARYASELGLAASGHAERAAERLAAAASRAEARTDVTAVVNLASRAIDLLPEDDARRPRLLVVAGRALYDAGRLDESLRALDEAVERGDAVTSARARAIRAYTGSLGVDSRAPQMIAEADRAVHELEPLGDDPALADAFIARTWLLFWSGRVSEMLTTARRALEHAARTQETHLETQAAALVLSALGYSNGPVDDVERFAGDLLSRGGVGPRLEARALIALGSAACERGRFDEARTLFWRGQRILEELGLEVLAAGTLQQLMIVEWLARDYEGLERVARTSWDRLGALGEVGFRSTGGAVLATALALLGRDAEAAAVAAESEGMTSPDDYVTHEWVAFARSRLAMNAGDGRGAVEHARQAVARAGEEDVLNRLVALIVVAEALRFAGDDAAAAEAVAEVAAIGRQRAAAAWEQRALPAVEAARQQ